MNTGLHAALAPLTTINRGRPAYIHFDNAASTPPLPPVISAVCDYIPWYSSVHRGSGLKSRLSTHLYEEARRIIRDFVGANATEHVVIFGKNTTEAINKLSYQLSLTKADIVLISQAEHHSNDLPWRAQATVKRIRMMHDGSIDKADYVALLKKYEGRVALVALSGASNVTGYTPDIHWFARLAHEHGSQILVDAAQLAAHRSITMRALRDPEHLDYVALSGHKMYAPFGSGALIARRDAILTNSPEYKGGGTVRFVTAKSVDWAPAPEVHEAGSPNVVGVVAMARAAKTLQAMDMKKIADHESELVRYALTRLKEVPAIQLYGSADPAATEERIGVISFTLAGKPSHLVSAILGYEWNIAVRSGCFCAHPYVMGLLGIKTWEQQRVGLDISQGNYGEVPGMVRISFGAYNTKAEIDRCVEALKSIACDQYGKYVMDPLNGDYMPADYNDEFDSYFKI